MQLLLVIFCLGFASAEEHRELVRKCLYAILGSGYSPLEFFDRDYNSYFLMAETLACVDLSTVSFDARLTIPGSMYQCCNFLPCVHVLVPAQHLCRVGLGLA